jgi:hypothetical protein
MDAELMLNVIVRMEKKSTGRYCTSIRYVGRTVLYEPHVSGKGEKGNLPKNRKEMSGKWHQV